ncbi:hypothetical protein HUJ05_000720 [Dendroctonus ponderosae]|nr:hypothetical protein HUJ05_000720 [Dendroctonus ponderosae]
MIHAEREVLKTIKSIKTQNFGHSIRGPRYHLFRLIIQGKVGERWIGGKKLPLQYNIRHWRDLQVEDLFRIDRDGFHIIYDSQRLNPGMAPQEEKDLFFSSFLVTH